MSFSLPKWLLPVVASLTIVGGGVAAAAIGSGDEPVIDEPVPTTEVTTPPDEAPDDGSAPEDGSTPEDDGTDEGTDVERYWGAECGDGPATNHGHYVSSAPRDGASRSEAAHSPCGKPLSSVTTPTAPLAPPEEDEEGEEGDTTVDEPAPLTSPSNGHGNGNGNGGGPPPGKGRPQH